MQKWLAAVGVLSALVATHGHAAPADVQTTEIRVRYDHRELSSAIGARQVLYRISKAALEACGASSFSLVEVKLATTTSACYKDAVDKAVRRVHDPLLSAAATVRHG